ncbi:hypothetical protein A2954_04885 [Candidatus Roizmanbacteria bacterium RIFCSPLOWO2_01_FULL_37_12]|uniref:LysM domain-containing protein n=1 Tax=Candidatus Roizmanbacteria bacterium RIFCSPLOWO2_01_FULL_37_12 TaxID=1802056 RepID=A0A1F7I8Q7_9BACT|nr:MAG: hypothetical protein A2768_01975 [Candidatus Roizmanbacteria bacterium RIFCSPHIGHO2_01_FULL_37_16]OGK23697.1 MAG: hypothetical protein A3D76_03925 [Candidatus Roizmanbacteria bacterium RIFCSPHIGHO2_02_FULL_37_9b]OGK39734.1 MAG: hypothetical protein A2954_04885 [Candidatus Roizmanbacteria bacterium RIFCSPLOWO2_01_FULL_37_12]
MFNDVYFYLARYQDLYPFLIPLGFIGIWRWDVWLTKKLVGLFYRPKKTGYKSSVSVVTPVYNEDPKTFAAAVESWAKNKPDEIIAVIDFTDEVCIKLFKDFTKKSKLARLIVTKVPGKREALADGIKAAKGEIIALIDSDTIWNEDTLKNALAPFADEKIGGVATRQSVLEPKTVAQKLFSIRLEQRYWDDIPFLATVEDVLVCLSGRTALYRKKAIMPILNRMVNEKFMGQSVISGEDKRLTYLIEEAGWKTTYQSNSQVFTTGVKDIRSFLNQQVRWTRNSWRNDLRAISDNWVFKHLIFSLYLIDRAIQPFTLLVSPIYFIVSLILGLWVPVVVILVWWHISRFVKMIPHLKKHPTDIWVLPIFILFSFISAYIRLYALFSLNMQGWITRWDKSRLTKFRFFDLARGHVMTIFVFGLVASGVVTNKYFNYLIPQEKQNKLIASTLQRKSNLASANNKGIVLGASTVDAESRLSKRHEFLETDSLAGIAEKYGVNFDDLLYTNVRKITNWNRIKPGIVFTIPPKGVTVNPSYRFNYQRIYDDFLQIGYDSFDNTIYISGRGYQAGIRDIFNSVGRDYLEEVSPKIWQLRANIVLRSGTTLKLNKEEVTWFRMASSKDKFVTLRASNADVLIDGVKITSWDEKKQDYDKNYQDGRSYILVKDSARMDVKSSEIAYLGFARPKDYPYSSYGISWRMSTGKLTTSLLTGEIENSRFHDNYFGAFTYGATGMTWRGNEFYNNVRYGLDPHDDSNGFLVENNKFYNNGSHGLIFSKRCVRNTIRNNISYNNKLHGIMLHELSNENVIRDNMVYNNREGISLDNSSKNIIAENKIFYNKRGVLADKKSTDNLIEKNEITENRQYGVYFYGQAGENVVRDNILAFNTVGVYIKTNANSVLNNQIDQNKVGVYFLGKAKNNRLDSNVITYSDVYGVYGKVSDGIFNLMGDNNLLIKNNRRDIAAVALE